ncbi:response regulator transcription factor [Catenovulum agarivorans]|uniref:response regulator transcription factor n=1 Tax=Catenovulum agarivorans TaxID=1172192 RepID=UPI0002D27DFF|nr:response regulator transcription factor [Catenovulum agarivorans]
MCKHILLVEDNPDIANIVSINLGMLDHKITVFSDGNTAYKQLNQNYDLAIFDIMLPGTDGLKLCKRMRQLHPNIPIIMLTAKSSELDLVVGLESGADDYLTKPFSVLELQARVKAHLRRLQNLTGGDNTEHLQQVLTFEQLEIDPNRYQIKLNGEFQDISHKEFELLHFLAQQPSRVFSREHLLEQIWGYQHANSAHTVNSTVNRLRAKLEDDPTNPRWLQTVWGVGYKFVAPSLLSH